MFFFPRFNLRRYQNLADAVANGANSGFVKNRDKGKEQRSFWRDYGDVVEIQKSGAENWQVLDNGDLATVFEQGVWGRHRDWSFSDTLLQNEIGDQFFGADAIV